MPIEAEPPWRFYPWDPGRHERFQGLRLLLVGESHYDPDPHLLARDHRDHTVQVVKDYGVNNHPCSTRLFKNVCSAFTGSATPKSKAEFWSSVCYCNYFQRAMWPPGEAPTEQDYLDSAAPFDALLHFLRPDCFVVMSDRLWKHMRNPCARIEYVGPLNGNDAFNFDVGGGNVASAIHINHPSPGGPPPFDPARWRPLLAEFLSYCRGNLGR